MADPIRESEQERGEGPRTPGTAPQPGQSADAASPSAHSAGKVHRILSLDGGGAKGFYTLGVLREIEGLLGGPLHKHFALIFGTSTGAIIAALLALGKTVEEIRDLYESHVPHLMSRWTRRTRTRALGHLVGEVFGDATFGSVLTGIGVVATKWLIERPMIFKGNVAQAHGRAATFVPGFGVSIADAVQASCSAYPFFERKTVTTSSKDRIELIDGGYCANNPTLYAIADSLLALQLPPSALRVLSIGVGVYPAVKARNPLTRLLKRHWLVKLFQKTLEINTQSMEQLRSILFRNVATVRISQTFSQPEMATDLMEHRLDQLRVLHQRGGESFASEEAALRRLLLG